MTTGQAAMGPESIEATGRRILQMLNEHGYEAYFVGGYVRDRLLGRTLKDIDIATDALPDDVVQVFPRTVPTGLKHGTITVLEGGIPFEVTTFRTESDYEQFRRPKQVEFVRDLEEDLRRRDFTMNAMAMDQEGALIDPFGGQVDLKLGLLRSVGKPAERFSEDALRMLRALRFASEYGLIIDSATWEALIALRPLLKHIAMERVRAELDKMLEGSDPFRSVQLLAESSILDYVKEDLSLLALHWNESLSHLAQRLNRVTTPELRWSLFFMAVSIGSSQAVETMGKLRFSRKKQERIRHILTFQEGINQTALYHESDANRARTRFLELVLRIGREAASDWLLIPGESPDSSEFRMKAKNWLDRLSISRVQELAVTGSELAEAVQQKPGPWLGIVLDRLLRDVAIFDVPNETARLISQAAPYVQRLFRNDEDG
jgi:tRNA nucleotidyltransferase (CCA-adding enzyme)